MRVTVPLLVLLVGVAVAYMVWRGTIRKPGITPPTPVATTQSPAAPPETPAATPTAATPTTPPGPSTLAGAFRAAPGSAEGWADLGSLDPASGYRMRVAFTRTGAGLGEVALTGHYTTILNDANVVVQRETMASWMDGEGNTITRGMAPLAVLAVEITPVGGSAQMVNLGTGGAASAWSPVPGRPGEFHATIQDEQGAPVLRVERAWTLAPGVHSLNLSQRLVNLTGVAMTVRLFQMGPIDLQADVGGYGGDKRRLRFGYLLSPKVDPARSVVVSDEFLMDRAGALGKRNDHGGYDEQTFWPNDTSRAENFELAWVGMTNRYYGAAVYPRVDASSSRPDKRLTWVQGVSRIVLDAGAGNEHLGVRLESTPVSLAPGATASMDASLYVGPLARKDIKAEPSTRLMGLAGLVVYNFGGPCGFCTFSSVTSLLLWLLHLLHDSVFLDWSLAIIFLVVIVRTCLHPVTRWSQIRMAVFGKQMSSLAPKQKEIQDKFRGDAKKIQEETQKLWREEGISPAGFLGCLPAFLQTPVWIALYATLYFAVELRHEGAFYGLFQAIQPSASPFWRFLGDLSESDRFIYFGKVLVTLPLLGPIDSINLLPLLLGVVFFIQQKYLTPPTSATLTPEQEMQQKMMKWMTVVMFPLFMYNAPSGLSLYFVTNSTLAIFESKWIRAHMDKHGMLDMDKMKALRNAKRAAGVGTGMWDRKDKAPPKPEGFFARLQRLAEEKQKQSQRDARSKRRP
ncbi:MAG: hypothetical protein HBSAPP03_05600 [Phycisphaerae bacterium]|nr:MAG: hypothetical protein HBSAPP03_05600 [Phycisphaerae bacterium]